MKKIYSIIIILIFVTLVGCSSSSGGGKAHMSIKGDPKSFAKDYSYQINVNDSLVKVKMDIEAEQGEFTWIVLDPDNIERWKDTIKDDETIEKSMSFPSKIGNWVIKVEGKNFKGDVMVEFHY